MGLSNLVKLSECFYDLHQRSLHMTPEEVATLLKELDKLMQDKKALCGSEEAEAAQLQRALEANPLLKKVIYTLNCWWHAMPPSQEETGNLSAAFVELNKVLKNGKASEQTDAIHLQKAVKENPVLQEVLAKHKAWVESDGLNNDQLADLAYTLNKVAVLNSEA